MLKVTTHAMPLGWIAELPHVQLEVVPAHLIGEGKSGTTTRKDGRYLIQINKNRPRVHRRWTLAHELKHVIDYPYANVWHAGLGLGDPEVQANRIEKIADAFAAEFLMPTELVKLVFASGIQDPRAQAEIFEVSTDAARIRMANLGLPDDDELPAAIYFRRTNFDHLTQGI
jgi:Zn-dependent peptidase ImmA (M78 family)